MSQEVEVAVRSPNAYAMSREALNLMEANKVWPTPHNFEIWLYVVADPQSALAQEVLRLIDSGEPMTEEISEVLANKYISRMRLSDEVRDAGLKLTKELSSITAVIADAQKSQRNYNQTLENASGELSHEDPSQIADLIHTLKAATKKVIQQSSELESRLSSSSLEVLKLRKHLEQVRIEAMTDALTNLANRKAFDERLEKHCDTEDAPLTLAVIDIDHFKKFNDTWGHQTGDQVLRYVASVLARVGREPRMAARYGGEEFGLIFPGESLEFTHAIMDQVRSEISSRQLKRRSTNEDLGSVTISVGLAERLKGEDAFSLVDRADAALYTSKKNGRNRVSCASSKDQHGRDSQKVA